MCSKQKHSIVIIGGGPGGYSAALSGALLGAEVTLVEDQGIGGAAVLTDVVPSKTLIASAVRAIVVEHSSNLGLHVSETEVSADTKHINRRILELAQAQSDDMRATLLRSGIRIVDGRGRLQGPNRVIVETSDGSEQEFLANTIILAVGASPRILPTAVPDGRRILTWKQLYDLDSIPEHIIVVGSGVTGAEFASAFRALGSKVTLVSSRDRVLPGEDEDATDLIQEVFTDSGMDLLHKARAESVVADEHGVTVTLGDGSKISGSHCLMAVGAIPNTAQLGLETTDVALESSGHIKVNRVACSTVPGIYAVGDCSNFLPLASVAEMQGQVAVYHALGENVTPIELKNLASTVFTTPEIATVGRSEKDIATGRIRGQVMKVDLSTNPRAKILGIKRGFIKLIVSHENGTVLGGVVVAPNASELIFPISLAVHNRLTVDELSTSFAVYPSLTLSIWHAARALHVRLEQESE